MLPSYKVAIVAFIHIPPPHRFFCSPLPHNHPLQHLYHLSSPQPSLFFLFCFYRNQSGDWTQPSHRIPVYLQFICPLYLSSSPGRCCRQDPCANLLAYTQHTPSLLNFLLSL
ncbi:hypothetical protein DdX_17517 [Ditylenchus destructor]|uniref:Uncharacterized protein n=1 Tax=Ditylenchus destructor TaxID=166010 RepID=A0AAD4ML99_9BILA|nr:hypothetical protein DdX_17517 [Ditylenchus destructor]